MEDVNNLSRRDAPVQNDHTNLNKHLRKRRRHMKKHTFWGCIEGTLFKPTLSRVIRITYQQ